MPMIFPGNFAAVAGLNRRNNSRNYTIWERNVSWWHWLCSHSGLELLCARTPAQIWLSLTALPRPVTIMRRRHRRARCYMFLLRW